MSKFFDETNNALRLSTSAPRPPATDVDVQELVGMIKDDLDRKDEGVQAAGSAAKLPFGAVLEDEADSPVAANRLQHCRLVSLPRDDRKSLLARQFNPDLQAAVEAYRTLRTRLLKVQAKTGMRSLALTSTAQGEGKTLSALNLGLCFSHLQDRSILVIDSDLRTKGLSRRLGLQDCIGLGDILENGPPFATAILRTDCSNLYLLPAGTSTTPPTELFSRAYWKEFIAWSGETFQMTLADAPPIVALADTELIIGGCEGVLLVARAGKTKRQVLAKALAQVGSRKLAGVVLNACDDASARNYYRYSKLGLRSAQS